MEELQYEVYCDVCGVLTKVLVQETEESPVFCSMCGTEAEVIIAEEE